MFRNTSRHSKPEPFWRDLIDRWIASGWAASAPRFRPPGGPPVPAGARKPPAKEPLLRLFAQGRKYGAAVGGTQRLAAKALPSGTIASEPATSGAFSFEPRLPKYR
jgi:hypothetical protein